MFPNISEFRLYIDFSASVSLSQRQHFSLCAARLVIIMLVFTVLTALLCSSLIDARLAPLNTPEALKLWEGQSQPYCSNPSLKINPETFHPTVNAPPSGEVPLNLAVKNNEPLSFKISAEAVT